MIRFIAAIDNKRGVADDSGIPWQGKIPGDVAYYRQQVSHGIVIMGYGLYAELSKPYPGNVNYVATSKDGPLRPGFQAVRDARRFLLQTTESVWNVGGAALYRSTIDLADELYLTKLEADFNCTKFFPEYEPDFRLVSESNPMTENDIVYSFCIYRRQKT